MFIFRHSWIPFIAVTCINAAIWWNRSRKAIAEKPELEANYNKLIRGLLIYGNIPWLIMGAGILFGGVPSTFHYFNPRNGPWVIAFYVSVVTMWILGVRWIYFQNGAEELVTCSGLFRVPFAVTPLMIKLYIALMIAGGVVGLSMMLTGNFQAPAFL